MILQLGDWKHITLAEIPKSIHNHYKPDVWVDATRMHEDKTRILIEFDPETAERLGEKIHLWTKTGNMWILTATI